MYDIKKNELIPNKNEVKQPEFGNDAKFLLEKARKAQTIQTRIEKNLSLLNSKAKNINELNTKLAEDTNLNLENDCIPMLFKPTRNNEYKISNFEALNEKESKLDSASQKSYTEFTDPRLIFKQKPKKALRFIRKGVLARAEIELNDPNLFCRKKKRQVRELFFSNDESVFSKTLIPELEHWDLPFVKRKDTVSEDEFPFEILVSKINNLIEHPAPLEPYFDPDENVSSVIFLTTKEKARLRRRNRQAKEMERQDRIRMGIEPPPTPRLKLSNLYNVLNEKAVAEPSNIEFEINKQKEERIMLHEGRNAPLKLNQEDKSKKKENKWKLDPDNSIVHAAIFKIDSLKNKRYIFKIDRNAHDCHLTGCCVISSIDPCIILVEGSKKSIQFYKNLLLNRIKWDQPKETATSCILIWEGVRPSRVFYKWKIYYCHSKEDAYRFFLDNNSLDLWNISQN
ncbi:U4 U6 associated RNA splicing factor [Cryptosporidium sp. chipmunk genotype I]|uniref:U4 U6 associated RNA splicing factor n=1 Tax=Cryptosporidium sp. chipmunk genotype I TaxID=1280935 RepID=UPI00351AA416|nr:U4 U6 associated RNA splicing factor [Cryptosporidium sp. chipmunk genotype I]